MPQLDLTLFGGFAAAVAAEPVTQFRTDKMRALLAYLAMNAERPFRRDILATLLWPEWSDKDARRNLRQTIHRLRQMLEAHTPALGDDLLTLTRQTVQLNGTAVSLDVTQFQQHLHACETHNHTHLHQCTDCLERMEQAAALYQGDLLAGFNLKDASPFEEWLIMEREQLQQQMLALLDRLAGAFEQQESYAQAQRYANQQVMLAPWQESAHRQLMRLFMLQNQRSAALAQYESCRELLAQELGVAPSAETVQLWQQIKAGTFVTAVSPHPRLHGFPTQLTPFIGRQQEINQIMHHLADDACRLLTLIGPGGIGKTRLSIRVGQEISAGPRRYRDGATFVPLAAVTSETTLVTTLAQHLNIQLTGPLPPRQQLLAELQDKELLLVCDNFEQVVDGAALLADIIAGAPGVQILVTSRQPLQIQAEWRQTLGGLDYSAGEASEAVRFFQRSAQRVSPHFQLGAEDGAAVLELCRLVDGLPLALEIAAAWTRLMDCATILRETQKSLDFLTSPLGDLPERHQSMRAVLAQSWQMLPDRLQTILGHMALFAGSFTMDAALAIVPDLSLLDMAALLDKSLLHWQPDGRYQMHELLRQFARDQELAESDAFRSGYGRFYLQFVAALESQLLSQNPQPAIAAFQQDLDNVRQAWRWAVDLGDHDSLAAALDGLDAYHAFRGTFEEGQRQFATAADALPPSVLVNRLRLAEAKCLEALGELARAIDLALGVIHTEEAETQLQALIRLGRLYERTSEYDSAVTTLEAALKLTDGLTAEAAQIWNILGLIYRYRGAANESIAAHQKALTICNVLEDALELAETHANLSLSYKDIAAYEAAVSHIEQALTIAKRLDHQEKICGFTHSLGVLYWQQDDLEQAKACWKQSLAVAEKINHKRLITICCNGLGVIARRHHRYEAALRYLRRALQLAQQLGEKSLQAIMLGIMGMVYQDIGEYEDAIAYLQQASTIDRSTGAISGVGRHLGNIGDTLKAQHRYAEALPYFEEAIGYLRHSAANYYLCWVLVSYAACLFECGRLDEAQTANDEGGRLASDIGREQYVLLSQLLNARMQARAGELQTAVTHLKALRDRFTTPDMLAEINYTLWQINGDPDIRAAAEAQFLALYDKTKIMAYRTRLAGSG